MHEFVGRTQTLSDVLDPARANALHATLGLSGAAPQAGDELPPFWHQIYFWRPLPEGQLGHDGHTRLGTGLIPDLGLPQRMWAGGQLEFREPVRIGEAAEKRSTVEKVETKEGRSGPLAFVTLRHEILQGGKLCVTEVQDLVFKTVGKGAIPPTAPTDEDHSETHSFSSTTLFRYSALTMNGHRIHYDLDFCREEEGYPGLVVHGPLLAQKLMLMARDRLGMLNRFTFRATAPLFHGQRATFCWRPDGTLWVRGDDGRQRMTATAA